MRSYVVSSALTFALVIFGQAAPVPAPQQENGRAPAVGNVEALWRDLSDADAARAYRAILALAKTPKETVAKIRGQLNPAIPHIRRLLHPEQHYKRGLGS